MEGTSRTMTVCVGRLLQLLSFRSRSRRLAVFYDPGNKNYFIFPFRFSETTTRVQFAAQLFLR